MSCAVSFQVTGLVYVTYNLETVGDMPVTVSLFLSTDGGVSYPHLCQSVTGDVGAGVMPGASRQIVWNAGLDYPRRHQRQLPVAGDCR